MTAHWYSLLHIMLHMRLHIGIAAVLPMPLPTPLPTDHALDISSRDAKCACPFHGTVAEDLYATPNALFWLLAKLMPSRMTLLLVLTLFSWPLFQFLLLTFSVTTSRYCLSVSVTTGSLRMIRFWCFCVSKRCQTILWLSKARLHPSFKLTNRTLSTVDDRNDALTYSVTTSRYHRVFWTN